ncbi:MAG: T9SS type A sorting domain-containing protein [Bacteroidia bacterium]|nr:T9SS type A sorting domain-containing protein [Bacteroidia bacterium]
MKKSFFHITFFFAIGILAAQNQITNFGNLMVHNNASVSVFGNLIDNGSIVDSGAVITLAGSNAQEIGGTSATTFKNLTLNNTAGSYLSSNKKITGELNISSGTFSTTGYDFTLVSDANGTARIAPILGNFSGNITMQRYLSGPTSWRFLASPVSGATLADWQDDFFTSGFPNSDYPSYWFTSIYTYDETVSGIADNGYVAPTDISDPIVPNKGYWAYIGPTPITVDVTGPPATFNQTFQVSYTASGGALNDGYVMIGNPYPCPIDWSSPNWNKTNINNAIYIWNPELQQYASWVSGVAVNGGSNLIASSQSFWVQANGFNPALSCNENVKVSNNTPFMRPSAPAVFDALKLSIAGNGYRDETLLRFGNTGTNGYDTDADARKLFSSNDQVPGIATQDSTLTDMSVNSLPPVTSLLHIPVKTLVGIAGNYTLQVDSSTFLAEHCIVLEDLYTGIKTNLSAHASYVFDISDTTTAARFLIHVSPSHKTKSIAASCNNYHNGKGIAEAKGFGPWHYQWSDTNNIVLKQKPNTFLPDTLSNLSAGKYVVRIMDVANLCGMYTQTITITEPLPVTAGFISSADTLVVGENLSVQNTSGNANAYTWNFGDGSPVENSYQPTSHSYSSPGEFKLSLQANNGNCSDSIFKTIVVLLPYTVGVSENSSVSRIVVYPNPSNGLFYVDIPGAEGTITVHSISGQLVFEKDLVGEKTELNLSFVNKGVYLYAIKLSSGKIQSGKLIIQ